MKSARYAALAALEKCRRSGAWSDAVIGSVMDSCGLSGRDRSMASAICYGVMQNVFMLDYYIDQYCSIKSSKLEPKVLDILRISSYQLIFMDRIPASAAVNEGVKLCRELGYGRASGMVNAVLRRISENTSDLPEINTGCREKDLSIRYSCPQWLTEYYLSELGSSETEKLLECQNTPVPVTIQVNTCVSDTAGLLESLRKNKIDAYPHKYLPDCIQIKEPGNLAEIDEFKSGAFYVQDAAAKMAVMAAEPKQGENILDACSAPGGKSFAAAVLTGCKANIIACDIHANKLKRIRDGAQRLKIGCIETIAADARNYAPEWHAAFDVVIADVPCSGLGVIRKKPDIRYKDPRELAELPGIQYDILSNLSRYVKPGGTLLYSTCTVRREENSEVIDLFLRNNSDFETIDFSLPGLHNSRNGMMQLWPQRDETDGFFIAKLRRKQ